MSLEEKIRLYEDSSDAATVDRVAVERLRRENEMLKRLLKSLGLDEAFQEAYFRAATQSPAIMKTLLPQQREDASEQLEGNTPHQLNVIMLSFDLSPVLFSVLISA